MENEPEAWHPWFLAGIIVVLFVALVAGWKTPEMAAFMALCMVWNAGIIDTKDAIAGFSNSGVLAVGFLFVVVHSVERSKLAETLATRAFGMNTGLRYGMARLCILCFVISGFLNNTPIVALFTPITRDWARTRGFSPSTFLIPLSYSTIFGGLLTVVGTSTNLVIMGLAEGMGLKSPGFFEIAKVGLPAGVIGIVYLVAVAPWILPKTGGLFQYAKENEKELVTEVQVEGTFKYIGQPVSLALAMLGIHRDCLIKIRRGRHRRARISATLSHDVAATNEPAGPPLNSQQAGIQALPPAEMSSSDARSSSLEIEPVEVEHSSLHAENPAARKLVSFVAKQSTDATAQQPARDHVDLYPVATNELLQEGDVLFLAGGRTTFMALHQAVQTRTGLRIMEGSAADLAGAGVQFVEVVLGPHNPFVGDIVAATSFGQHYGVSILAIRRKGRQTESAACIEPPAESELDRRFSLQRFSLDRWPGPMASREYVRMEGQLQPDPSLSLSEQERALAEPPMTTREEARGQGEAEPGGSTADTREEERSGGQPVAAGAGASRASSEDAVGEEEDSEEERKRDVEVGRSKLFSGDVVLALAPEGFAAKWGDADDFLMVTTLGHVPKRITLYDYVPVLIFAGMIAWVAADQSINMVQAAMAATALVVLGGWVDARKAVGLIPWDLLVLIASMLGISRALETSGLADFIAQGVQNAGLGPRGALFLVFAVTTTVTEILSNNAAAGLIFPIAITVAKRYGVSYMPFMIAIMCAASASFMTPIGYQTNMMVWGPGGYKFLDFTKIGAPLSAIYMVCCCVLIPIIWPFDKGPMGFE
mmetsp:Transcript_23543/g.56159  ORF Transcript_23543/g.56159 Transcript_23543/m.56159 type:complete len:821 (+) Transcript_23543:120-2582(+)